ncbi:hypothetical protein K0O13_08015 [Mammaliicoccus sciuri]|uniref:hypothetical protein n=1 Tax=Mammaliicoccus sciuri TaxID=1296 RepID=UPI001C631DE1|nr:hypothetical protein [Mammaliicoccus sciuri]QYG30045.1 hypothetical protein K0O13_08015 [Mammaliicoccus sciuri]
MSKSDKVELDFKFDIEKVLKHAKEVGLEVADNTEENEQGGFFYKNDNGELVKWDVMKEMFPLEPTGEAIDRVEERLIEAKKPVGKPFEHKNKKSIKLDLEETYLEIKDKIQNMSSEEIEKINNSLKEANSIAMTVDETDLLIEKISGKESKIGKNNFYVLEVSRDDFGHEYEVVYEVVNGFENAMSLCNRLNKNNDDQDAYYEVQYVDPNNLWLGGDNL